MAHKLLNIEDGYAKKKRKLFTMPDIQGKFGVGIMVGQKEYFLGLTINSIVVEQVVRRKLLKPPKGKTKVFTFED